MLLLLVFGVMLLLAVLVSSLANRTVVSTAALFLVAGVLLGRESLGVLDIGIDDPLVGQLSELALFSVLFTDGMKTGLPELRSAWRLPGRALVWGLPLTLLFIAVIGHLVVGLPWLAAFLVGAALSSTDPVFAAAIVGREEIPFRLRNLLNVESGLNDGLALPMVVVLLSFAGSGSPRGWELMAELAGGVAIGVVIPWAAIKLVRLRVFGASAAYQPLGAVAVGLIVLTLASITDANVFLAGFAAGITNATLSAEATEAFHRFGELLTELLKLGALLVFGALVSPSFVADVGFVGVVFAVLVLFVARPVPIEVALIGSELEPKERLAAAWFGPKGFASVVYGLLIFQSGIPRNNQMFHLIAVAVALSILLHSSTDVVVARWFEPGKGSDHPSEDPTPSESTPKTAAIEEEQE